MSDTNLDGILPVGKIPPAALERLLAGAPVMDERVLVGPGIGLDCAVVESGPGLLVLKSDPITFATQEIGWYAVQINSNDLATSGARPRWFMMTLLLPEGQATLQMAETIFQQVYAACREIEVAVIGGHSEITHDLQRPILVGTMIGEVGRERLVTPRGAQPGDRLLLTKGVPIEATAILAREFAARLQEILSPQELQQAQDMIYRPGLSVLPEARLAQQAGRVTAMHDPTEGGLAAALWELAQASGRRLVFDPHDVPVPPLAARLCQIFDLDPLEAIASGALLLTAPAADAPAIRRALEGEGIPCAEIGWVEDGAPQVWRQVGSRLELQPQPQRDAIARLFEG